MQLPHRLSQLSWTAPSVAVEDPCPANDRLELLTTLPPAERGCILHTFDVLLRDALASRVAA